jgi:hypothetical protein
MLISCMVCSSNLEMEAVCSSETSVGIHRAINTALYSIRQNSSLAPLWEFQIQRSSILCIHTVFTKLRLPRLCNEEQWLGWSRNLVFILSRRTSCLKGLNNTHKQNYTRHSETDVTIASENGVLIIILISYHWCFSFQTCHVSELGAVKNRRKSRVHLSNVL